jgi:3-hydroxymyristoyl/3-hydroxydecanoyl-(acyl carrier protein) dehydratase
MKSITLELLSEHTNSAVVRLPDRRFPGVVIPGDSLHILHSLMKSIIARCAENQVDGETPADLAREAQQILAGYLRVYETALQAHGYTLPYTPSCLSL